MKLEGKHKFKAPLEEVWDVLIDPKCLQEAIPGCDTLTEREPGKYDLILKVGIAAVKGTYEGKAEIADAEPPNRYRLIMEGSGSTGFVKGEADIELSQGDKKTLVSYRGEAQVGGLIAGVGQRLVGGVAKMMLGQFFRNMEKQLKAKK